MREHLECAAAAVPGRPAGAWRSWRSRGDPGPAKVLVVAFALPTPVSELTVPQGHCPLCPRRCVRLSYQDFGRESEGEEVGWKTARTQVDAIQCTAAADEHGLRGGARRGAGTEGTGPCGALSPERLWEGFAGSGQGRAWAQKD